MNRKIVRVVVEEADGQEVEYRGHGTASVVDTFVPGDKEADTKDQKVRYLSLILALPVYGG